MLIIRPLDPSHDRKAFDCGVPVLNDFLQKTARQHRDKGLSNTFVLLDEAAPQEILGFFTLSFLEVDAATLHREYSRHLPRSSRLPSAKLARLAVDKRCHGKGYGELLMADAVKRIMATINESGGITGFFVDAKDEHARRFYLRFGFIPLQDAPLTLFLPLQTLLKGLEKSAANR
ncbi:MAG: GNAT family N-acetyltransferase [Deltaproteobacteria bacterium]|nr:GNAT family N-acetyltransferase [Deltaproteobacteria bacterium]